MIYDKTTMLPRYQALNPQIVDACRFMSMNDPNVMELEKQYPLGNAGGFVFLTEYQTKPVEECFIETHKRFIDLQIMIQGSEQIGYIHLDDAQPLSYDETKDVQVINGPTETFTFNAGEFVIFYPEDGHMPAIQITTGSASLKKLVFKLRV